MKPETANELAEMLEQAERRIADAEMEILRFREEQAKAKAEATHLRGILEVHGATAGSPVAEAVPTHAMQQPVKFRDAIRDALEIASGSVSISDVADHLQHLGFSPDGATPLAVRVGNELYKLANQGEIERAKRGHYQLKDKT
jgi:hypothetical protein